MKKYFSFILPVQNTLGANIYSSFPAVSCATAFSSHHCFKLLDNDPLSQQLCDVISFLQEGLTKLAGEESKSPDVATLKPLQSAHETD